MSCDCKSHTTVFYIYCDYLNSIIIFLYFLLIHSFRKLIFYMNSKKTSMVLIYKFVWLGIYVQKKTFDSLGLSSHYLFIISLCISTPSYYLFNLCISQSIINIHLSMFIISHVLLYYYSSTTTCVGF